VEDASDVLGGDRARYRWFLEKQYGFYAPLEPRLALAPGLAALGLEVARRQRAHLFAADLLHLGAHPGRLPRCAALPRVDTAARALGAMYVLEGSTFGGAFILRHLASSLALAPGAGASGIVPYGDGLTRMWIEYTDALDRFVTARPADEPEVQDAARETFERMLAWFREPAPAAVAEAS
jgi:heme oxygenase